MGFTELVSGQKVRCQTTDSTTGADGTVLVDLPVAGNGRLRSDCERSDSGESHRRGTHVGLDLEWIAASIYARNAQAQIVADKKSYQVGDDGAPAAGDGADGIMGRGDGRGRQRAIAPA